MKYQKKIKKRSHHHGQEISNYNYVVVVISLLVLININYAILVFGHHVELKLHVILLIMSIIDME